MRPIFIVSLPRSGSTLLQRVLSTSSDIATTPEPWVALPIAYMMKNSGESSEYGKKWEKMAFDDFFDFKTAKVFYRSAEIFLSSLYESKCENNERYFLDKTPRYYMILDELKAIFPEAKFIILTRNPLEVIASSIDTWGKKGCWNIHALKLDLTQGIKRVTRFLCENNDVLHMSYQELTSDLFGQISKIENYLGIELDNNAINNIGEVKIGGALGDPTGVKEYAKIQAKPKDYYVNSLNGVLRKAWIKRYLNTLSIDELGTFGIHKQEILRLLESTPTKYSNVFSDLSRMAYGQLYNYLDLMHFVQTYKNSGISKKVGFR